MQEKKPESPIKKPVYSKIIRNLHAKARKNIYEKAARYFDNTYRKYRRRPYNFPRFTEIFMEEYVRSRQKRRYGIAYERRRKSLRKSKWHNKFVKILLLKNSKEIARKKKNRIKYIDTDLDFKKTFSNFFSKFYIRKDYSKKHKRARKRGYISHILKNDINIIHKNYIFEHQNKKRILLNNFFNINQNNEFTRIERLTYLKVFNSITK